MTAKIIQNGDKVLRQVAKELTHDELKSARVRGLLAKMTRAMETAENGVAIAAPQVGESLRIFLVDGNVLRGFAPVNVKNKKLSEAEKEDIKYSPAVFINPTIKKTSKKQQEVEEGCLSVDGIYGKIKRAEKLTVEALDEKGRKFSRGCSGLLAQIVQHEMDHLNGVLFIDTARNLRKTKRGQSEN